MTTPVHTILPAGSWIDADRIDSIVLDHDQRHRRRLLLKTTSGRDILLDLPRAQCLRDGDALQLADGLVAIVAADEPVMDIHAAPDRLMRIAWHLGNRHLPVQLAIERLRIRDDHVIAELVAGLGGHVHRLNAPFEPERGAYELAQGNIHAHDHQHG